MTGHFLSLPLLSSPGGSTHEEPCLTLQGRCDVSSISSRKKRVDEKKKREHTFGLVLVPIYIDGYKASSRLWV